MGLPVWSHRPLRAVGQVGYRQPRIDANQQQQQYIIEFQRTEIEVLKKKLYKKRIVLHEDQRRGLVVKAKVLGRKLLEEIGAYSRRIRSSVGIGS